MRNNRITNPFENLHLKRIKKKISIIHTGNGDDLELEHIEIIEKTPEGDFESEEVVNSLILATGEKISSHLQLAGRCLVCQGFVTHKSIRRCFKCGKILCPLCAKYWELTKLYACRDCHKTLKRKALFSSIGKLLVSPFIKKD